MVFDGFCSQDFQQTCFFFYGIMGKTVGKNQQKTLEGHHFVKTLLSTVSSSRTGNHHFQF